MIGIKTPHRKHKSQLCGAHHSNPIAQVTLDKNGTQENIPFSGSVIHVLSCGIFLFLCECLIDTIAYDWVLKNSRGGHGANTQNKQVKLRLQRPAAR